MDRPLLSILICHLPERRELLNRLLRVLIEGHHSYDMKQVTTYDLVHRGFEITINPWSRAEATTGQKRNHMVQGAAGDFICFIDDDDLVADNYVAKILETIKRKPTNDCIGLVGQISWQGEKRVNPKKFIHSIEVNEWHEKDDVYYRTPNHLNPIAARHAKAVEFPDITVGEDHIWSDAIRPLLKHEIMIEDTLYYYECR